MQPGSYCSFSIFPSIRHTQGQQESQHLVVCVAALKPGIKRQSGGLSQQRSAANKDGQQPQLCAKAWTAVRECRNPVYMWVYVVYVWYVGELPALPNQLSSAAVHFEFQLTSTYTEPAYIKSNKKISNLFCLNKAQMRASALLDVCIVLKTLAWIEQVSYNMLRN